MKILPHYGHFIKGSWQQDRETLLVCNKYTGDELATVGMASREIVREAVGNAYETFNNTELPPTER